jgi:hypothetical protein
MFNKKTQAILLLTSSLLFTACGSASKNAVPQPYRALNLDKKSESFKKGAHDGCMTAAETYKKDHEAFNNDFEYNEGWWAGRRNCEGREYAEY